MSAKNSIAFGLSRRRAIGSMAAAGLFGCFGCDVQNAARHDTIKPEHGLPVEVNGCKLSLERRSIIASCAECAGPESPVDEWNHSCLHPAVGVYDCGRMALPGQANRHDHDPAEIARCRDLAREAAAFLEGELAVGSEGGEPYRGFYIAANQGDEVPNEFSVDLVHRFFGSTIYPAAIIQIEPLNEEGKWWQEVLYNYSFEEGGLHLPPGERASNERHLEQWRKLVRWFREKEELHAPSYIAVGDLLLSETNFGCVFPRLNVALTRSGSVVGVFTPVVHT